MDLVRRGLRGHGGGAMDATLIKAENGKRKAEIPKMSANGQDETDFAVQRGRIKVRAEWLFRGLSLIMLIVCNAQAYWLARKFVSREEVQQAGVRIESSMNELKTTLVSVEREMAVMNSSTTDQDQSRRLDDHEQRLRKLENRN